MVTEDMAMKIATFRFGVIADFVTGVKLSHGERQRLIEEKAHRTWLIPGTDRTRISKSTIHLWTAAYKKAGYRIEGLMPKPRKDRATYRKLDSTLRMAIKDCKLENPNYTVPVIIKKLKHKKLIGPDDPINTSSVYRFIRQEGLDRVASDPKDKRRFEASYPNGIWQCDVMHGPLVKVEGGPQKKSYLCAIMDDHSRLLVHGQFYLNETLDSLLDCLHQALLKRGLPQKFYVDNGACYRALHLEQTLASLGIAITHSRPYTPQGRGKIERWFRYVRQDFIPLHAEKPLTLERLNERLEGWIDEYNDSIHSAIKTTPYERFKKDLACIRPAPEDLLNYFRKVERRKVKKDRTVQLNGRFYEVPVGLIDKKVELKFHADSPEDVEIFFEDRSYGKAVILDSHVNATIGRDYGSGYTKKEKKTRDVTPEATEISTGKLFNTRHEEGCDVSEL